MNVKAGLQMKSKLYVIHSCLVLILTIGLASQSLGADDHKDGKTVTKAAGAKTSFAGEDKYKKISEISSKDFKITAKWLGKNDNGAPEVKEKEIDVKDAARESFKKNLEYITLFRRSLEECSTTGKNRWAARYKEILDETMSLIHKGLTEKAGDKFVGVDEDTIKNLALLSLDAIKKHQKKIEEGDDLLDQEAKSKMDDIVMKAMKSFFKTFISREAVRTELDKRDAAFDEAVTKAKEDLRTKEDSFRQKFPGVVGDFDSLAERLNDRNEKLCTFDLKKKQDQAEQKEKEERDQKAKEDAEKERKEKEDDEKKNKAGLRAAPPTGGNAEGTPGGATGGTPGGATGGTPGGLDGAATGGAVNPGFNPNDLANLLQPNNDLADLLRNLLPQLAQLARDNDDNGREDKAQLAQRPADPPPAPPPSPPSIAGSGDGGGKGSGQQQPQPPQMPEQPPAPGFPFGMMVQPQPVQSLAGLGEPKKYEDDALAFRPPVVVKPGDDAFLAFLRYQSALQEARRRAMLTRRGIRNVRGRRASILQRMGRMGRPGVRTSVRGPGSVPSLPFSGTGIGPSAQKNLPSTRTTGRR